MLHYDQGSHLFLCSSSMSLFLNFMFIDQHTIQIEILYSLINLNWMDFTLLKFFYSLHESCVHLTLWTATWLLFKAVRNRKDFIRLASVFLCLKKSKTWSIETELFKFMTDMVEFLMSDRMSQHCFYFLHYLWIAFIASFAMVPVNHSFDMSLLWTKILNSCMCRDNLRWGSKGSIYSTNAVFRLLAWTHQPGWHWHLH